MEEIAISLTDVIAILAPTELGEDPAKMVSKIEEDLESYTKKFELFKVNKKLSKKEEERLSLQNKEEEYGIGQSTSLCGLRFIRFVTHKKTLRFASSQNVPKIDQ